MTPTQLAYKAWLATTQPIPYSTRDAKGNDIIVDVELLHPHTHQAFEHGDHGACVICGAGVDGGVPVKKMLGTTYTDWDIHKSPESTHVCAACVWALMMNVKKGRQTLFRYSFMASEIEGLTLLNRRMLRDALLSPPTPPFVCVVAVSQKKHLITKSCVSFDRNRYQCNLEEECIEVCMDVFRPCIHVVEALRGLGCTTDEILSGAPRFDKFKEWGADNYERATRALAPYLGTRILHLAVVAARKNESKENCKCYLDFQPRI